MCNWFSHSPHILMHTLEAWRLICWELCSSSPSKAHVWEDCSCLLLSMEAGVSLGRQVAKLVKGGYGGSQPSESQFLHDWHHMPYCRSNYTIMVDKIQSCASRAYMIFSHAINQSSMTTWCSHWCKVERKFQSSKCKLTTWKAWLGDVALKEAA